MFLGTLAVLVFARPTPTVFWIGLPFVIMGQVIRIWSAGCLSKLKKLATDGPFALCRNPLYIGSFLLSVGLLIMCGRPWVGLAGVVLFWVFHGGAVAYEEKLLRETFGAEFDHYCRRVPRFVPRFPRSAGDAKFSIEQAKVNNEIRATVVIVLVVSLFCVVTYMPWLSPLALITSRLGGNH